MHCVQEKYDEELPLTSAGREELDNERITLEKLDQTKHQAVEMDDLQHGPKLACNDLLPRIDKTMLPLGPNSNRKWQKKTGKHRIEPAKKNELTVPAQKDAYPTSEDHAELNESFLVNNIQDTIQQKSQVHTSQSGIGSSVRRFKQFIHSLTVSKSTRKKLIKLKADKSRNAPPFPPKRRFCVLSKGDKKYIRVQLSIWFPCLFPRPTFNILKEAIVQITTSIYHDLCRLEVTGMNQQITQSKAQRTIFRKEQMRERFSKVEPIFFLSNAVPECQKQVSSFTVSIIKSGSATSKENCSSKIGIIPKLMTDESDVTAEQCSTVDAVKQRSHVLSYTQRDKYMAAIQTTNLRHNEKNYYAFGPLPRLEIKHHHVPQWFRSMIIKNTAIYILPMESEENNETTSCEIKHFMKLQRRILLSGFHHGEEMSSATSHLFVSVLEQEATAQCAAVFKDFNTPSSTQLMLQTEHAYRSTNEAKQYNQINCVSGLDKDSPINSETASSVIKSSPQTNTTSVATCNNNLQNNNLQDLHFRQFQKNLSPHFDDLDVRVESTRGSKTPDCQMITQSRGRETCKKPHETGYNSYAYPHVSNGKKVKRVRFNGAKRLNEQIIDYMNKSNSSVHGVQEVCERDPEIVIDNVRESKQFSTVTCNKEGEKTGSVGIDDIVEKMQAKPIGEPRCSGDKKCASTSNFYFDQDFRSDELNHVVEKSNSERKLGTKAKCPESCSLYDAQNWKAVKSRGCKENVPDFSCSVNNYRNKNLKIHFSRQESQQTIDASRKIILDLSKESLIQFVKEQWRSRCPASHAGQPKSLAMEKQSPKKQCLWEQKTASSEPDTPLFEVSKKDLSSSYPNLKSPFWSHEVACDDDDMNSHSLQREPSFEDMCTERRENYQKLCQTLTNYFESNSPEDSHDAHSSYVSPIKSPQLSEANMLKTQDERKAHTRCESFLLDSMYVMPINGPATTVSTEIAAPATACHVSFKANVDRPQNNTLEKSAISLVDRACTQSTSPEPYSSYGNGMKNVKRASEATLAKTKHGNTTVNKQTQTSPMSIFARNPNVIQKSIAAKLNLSQEETEWLMSSMNPQAATEPQKPSHFHCILFALDRLLAHYFQLIDTEKHRLKKFNENSKHSKTGKKKTHMREDPSLKTEPALTHSSHRQLRDFRRENVHSSSSRNAKYCRRKPCKVEMSELAQNCSVNNGQDSPPTTSQNVKLKLFQTKKFARKRVKAKLDPVPEMLSPDVSLNRQSVKIPANDYQNNSPNDFISQHPATPISLNPAETFSPDNNISQSTAKNVSKSPAENVPQPTGYVSRFPPWNVPNSPISSPNPDQADNLTLLTDKRNESGLVKEFRDTRLTFPTRLLLMPEHSNKHHALPADAESDNSTRAQTSSQSPQQPNIKTYNNPTQQPHNCPVPVDNSEAIKRTVFLSDDPKAPVGRLAFDAKISYKLQHLSELYCARTASPKFSISPENWQSKTEHDIYKKYDLPQRCWPTQNSPREQDHASPVTDFDVKRHTRAHYHHEYEHKTAQLPNFESPQVNTARLHSPDGLLIQQPVSLYPLAQHSPDRSAISGKINTELTLGREYCKGSAGPDQTPYQMSPSRTMFRNICDSANKTSTPTSAWSRQQTNPQTSNQREFKIGAEIQYEHTLGIGVESTKETHLIDSSISASPTRITFAQPEAYKGSDHYCRNLSKSPRQPSISDFSLGEVDNRLLDPSKHYNDVFILEDSYKPDPKIRNRAIAVQEHVSSRPGALHVSFEEKNSSYTADKLNVQHTEQCAKVFRPVEDEVLNTTAELHLVKTNRLTGCSKTKGTSSSVNVCIQTCACISKHNGTCLCGYLSITDKLEPKKVCEELTPNYVAKARTEINVKSVSAQTSSAERRGKQADVCASKNKYVELCFHCQAQPGSRRLPSPSKTKYRNKKCQIRHSVAAKSDLKSPSPCRQHERNDQNWISPIAMKCIQKCLDKINNQCTPKKEPAISARYNLLLENTTKQFETLNPSCEATTNSSDDSEYKLCHKNNCRYYEQNMSNLSSHNVHECSEHWKPKQKIVQAPRCPFDDKSDHDSSSSMIVDEIDEKRSSDECYHIKEKVPKINIRNKSRHDRKSPQCHVCSSKAQILSQQLEEQISGIIENSRLLQEQATKLRNKCKRLDQQQWSPVNWDDRDAQCQCQFDHEPDCENNNVNSDKNANANLSSDKTIHEKNNLTHVNTTTNVSTLTRTSNSNEKQSERKKEKHSTTLPTKVCNVIQAKKMEFHKDKYNDRSCSLFSRKNESKTSISDYEKRNGQSCKEIYQRKLGNSGSFFTQDCRLLLQDDEDQSWNARPLAQQDITEKKNTKLNNRKSLHNKRYFFNDPSEEAYQYMKAHFPGISMHPQQMEGTSGTFDTYPGVCSCSNAMAEGDKKLLETHSRVASALKKQANGTYSFDAGQRFERHDLQKAKLTQCLLQSESPRIKCKKSEPGLREWNNTSKEGVEQCEVWKSFDWRDRHHLGSSIGHAVGDFQSNVPLSMAEGDNDSLSVISYKTGTESLPSKSYWQHVHKADSINQRAIPIRSAKDSTHNIGSCFHKLHSNKLIIRDSTSLTEDRTGTSSFQNLHKVKRLAGTMSSFTQARNSHRINVIPLANSSRLSPPTQGPSKTCSSYGYSASAIPPNISEPDVHELAIDSCLYVNKDLHAPAVCAVNGKTRSLHQCHLDTRPALDTSEPTTKYQNWREPPIKSELSSAVESVSEMSLISVKVAMSPGNELNVLQGVAFPVISVDSIDSPGFETKAEIVCGEEKLLFSKDHQSADGANKIFQKQQRDSFPRRKKKYSVADNAISHESETREKSEHLVRNKHRVLPEVTPCIRRTHKLSAVDSQDSSLGIENLPLDSSVTEVEHAKFNLTQIKLLKNSEVVSNKVRRTQCKCTELVHKPTSFARPLPTYGRKHTILQDAKVKLANTNSAEQSVPTNCSNVVTIETAGVPTLRLPVKSVKPKLQCDKDAQITLGEELKQFEVSTTCTDADVIVAETINNTDNKGMCRNSPEHFAKFRTNMPLSFSNKAINDADNSISSNTFELHPPRRNSNRKSRCIDILPSHSRTTAPSLENENSFINQTFLAKETLNIVPENIISLHDTETPSSHQWRTCLFGCAEVTTANDNIVVIEGDYIKRFPSGMMFNEIVKNKNKDSEDKRSGWQQKKLVPFKLMLSKDLALGDSDRVVGTYSRWLLTSNDFVAWNFIADGLS